MFEEKYFIEYKYKPIQIERFFKSAFKDLKIANKAEIIDIKFQFTYNALVKIGIALIACKGYKAKSRAGHHIKIIENASEILKDKDFEVIANQMRKIRNTELYEGGYMISQKQANDFCRYIKKVFNNSKEIINKRLNKLI